MFIPVFNCYDKMWDVLKSWYHDYEIYKMCYKVKDILPTAAATIFVSSLHISRASFWVLQLTDMDNNT